MKNRLCFLSLAVLVSFSICAQHNAGNNGRILMIASNPAVSRQTGWNIGVWYAELAHPYWVFSEAGYSVDIASPDGGEIKFDDFSDPEHESKYAAFDFVSLGFKKDSSKMALTKNTLRLSSVDPGDYKAIFVCGGQGPMYTFINDTGLHSFFTRFYLTGKPAAAICHGTCILLKTKLPDGKFLVEGKKWTGFASSEEQYADNYVGMKIQPFRIEDEARKMPNSKFVTAAPFSAFAVRDGNLITGQQQNSGEAAARLVLQALEADRARYPTYVLVHGAWADEIAWGFVRNELARKANVVVVNLPAHGIDLSDGKTVGQADYVKVVTDAVKSQSGKVILVGHSMAGAVISQVAENIPARIDKLIYVSAYLPQNGESVSGITNRFRNDKPIEFFEFNSDYSLVSIKKEVLPAIVCADCPDYMKEILVKYHRAEPVKGLNDKVKLSTKFAAVPKYYIATTNDKAVPFELQQQMIKSNGSVKKVYEMNTSHLPFVVDPEGFIGILKQIN